MSFVGSHLDYCKTCVQYIKVGSAEDGAEYGVCFLLGLCKRYSLDRACSLHMPNEIDSKSALAIEHTGE